VPKLKTYIMKKVLLLSILSILMGLNAKATHNYGGEITYEWVSASTYNVRLVLYVDCQGPPPTASININIASASCALNQVKTLF
jgi:hypothetical protein